MTTITHTDALALQQAAQRQHEARTRLLTAAGVDEVRDRAEQFLAATDELADIGWRLSELLEHAQHRAEGRPADGEHEATA